MEQTLREKYGYTDDTYGQRYIKRTWRRRRGIAGRACEMCWLKRREKDVKIVGQDHLLKNLHTIGLQRPWHQCPEKGHLSKAMATLPQCMAALRRKALNWKKHGSSSRVQ